MKSEEEMKKMLIGEELAKIRKLNPNAIPLYIIVNSLNPKEAVEQPITLCNQESTVKDLLSRLKVKYPKYPNIYLFAKSKKEHPQENKQSSKSKRKKKNALVSQQQELIAIDESIYAKLVEEIHQIYQDSHGLLILVVSETLIHKEKKKSMCEILLYVLAAVFALTFLYLTFIPQEQPKGESQLDYIL